MGGGGKGGRSGGSGGIVGGGSSMRWGSRVASQIKTPLGTSRISTHGRQHHSEKHGHSLRNGGTRRLSTSSASSYTRILRLGFLTACPVPITEWNVRDCMPRQSATARDAATPLPARSPFLRACTARLIKGTAWGPPRAPKGATHLGRGAHAATRNRLFSAPLAMTLSRGVPRDTRRPETVSCTTYSGVCARTLHPEAPSSRGAHSDGASRCASTSASSRSRSRSADGGVGDLGGGGGGVAGAIGSGRLPSGGWDGRVPRAPRRAQRLQLARGERLHEAGEDAEGAVRELARARHVAVVAVAEGVRAAVPHEQREELVRHHDDARGLLGALARPRRSRPVSSAASGRRQEPDKPHLGQVAERQAALASWRTNSAPHRPYE